MRAGGSCRLETIDRSPLRCNNVSITNTGLSHEGPSKPGHKTTDPLAELPVRGSARTGLAAATFGAIAFMQEVWRTSISRTPSSSFPEFRIRVTDLIPSTFTR